MRHKRRFRDNRKRSSSRRDKNHSGSQINTAAPPKEERPLCVFDMHKINDIFCENRHSSSTPTKTGHPQPAVLVPHYRASALLDTALANLENRYEPGPLTEFYARWCHAGFDKFFRTAPFSKITPLFVRRSSQLKELSVGELSVWEIHAHAEPVGIELSTGLTEALTLEDLFGQFITIAHHLMRVDHFRDFPEYFVDVLSDNRYFVFHGDGFCCQLAVLFQALAREVLGLDLIAAYCSAPDRAAFSHGYCTEGDPVRPRRFIDPDLKSIFEPGRLQTFEPATWFINFVENQNIDSLLRLVRSSDSHLLTNRMRQYVEWLGTCCTRELSRPNSRYSVTRDLLRESLAQRAVVYDVLASDYPWKKRYRDVASAKGIDSKQLFLSRLQKSVRFELPRSGSLALNMIPPGTETPIEALMNGFFGRVPLSFAIPLQGELPTTVALPDVPWILALTPGVPTVVINDVLFSTRSSGESAFLSLGDLERVGLTHGSMQHLRVDSERSTTLTAVFPCNASLFGSGLLRLAREPASAPLDVSSWS